MLNIYTRKDSIPSNLSFVQDPEKLLAYLKLTYSEMDREVIRIIEQGEVIDAFYYLDRFRCKCSVDWLSTTSKILLGVEQTDFIVNGVELGYDGYHFLCLLGHGNIYLPNIPTHLPNIVDGPQVCVDRVRYDSFYDAWLGGC